MTSKHKTFRLFEWKSCRQQGLRLWECPSFLFLFTGGVTVILMLATYFVSQIYASVEITLASIVIVTTFMMVIAFIMDQTMTKVAQARIHLHLTNHELKTAVAKLEHSEKLRRDFTSMVIHDLKSPLKGVQLLGESVKKIHSVVSFKQLAVIGKTIETSAMRMIDLVNNLLMIDKVDAGKFIIVRKTGSVEALLRDQIAIVKPQAREKHITLALMVPKKLPQLAFDRAQTERILGNILSNAIKFTPKKGRVMVHAFVHARCMWPGIRNMRVRVLDWPLLKPWRKRRAESLALSLR